MDDKKVLNDDNLEKLNFIKDIDTYCIVDRNLNKKRKNKSLVIISCGIVFVCLASIFTILIGQFIKSSGLLNMIIIHYFFSTSILMLLIIPIIKEKRTRIN